MRAVTECDVYIAAHEKSPLNNGELVHVLQCTTSVNSIAPLMVFKSSVLYVVVVFKVGAAELLHRHAVVNIAGEFFKLLHGVVGGVKLAVGGLRECIKSKLETFIIFLRDTPLRAGRL